MITADARILASCFADVALVVRTSQNDNVTLYNIKEHYGRVENRSTRILLSPI